mgnify:CR=1 FL=1
MAQNEYKDKNPIIYLAGIGMGREDQLTGEVLDCLDRADAVMGARRMLDAAAPYTEGKAVLAAYKPSEMVNWLSSFQWNEAVFSPFRGYRLLQRCSKQLPKLSYRKAGR